MQLSGNLVDIVMPAEIFETQGIGCNCVRLQMSAANIVFFFNVIHSKKDWPAVLQCQYAYLFLPSRRETQLDLWVQGQADLQSESRTANTRHPVLKT